MFTRYIPSSIPIKQEDMEFYEALFKVVKNEQVDWSKVIITISFCVTSLIFLTYLLIWGVI